MGIPTPAIQADETRLSEGLGTAILLLLMLASVSGSIFAANWADGLAILTYASILAAIFGMAMARLPVRGFFAHVLMLSLTLPVTAFFASLLIAGDFTLVEKLVVVQLRLQEWLTRIMRTGTATDSFAFVFELTGLIWIIGYFAAWFIFRRAQVWGAILPSGIAIVINLFYTPPQNGLYLGLFLLSAILLVVRLNLTAMERWWRHASIGYTSDIGYDFLTYSIGITLVLMFVVWLLPASAPGPSWLAAFEPLQGPWKSFEDQFTRAFASLRGAPRPVAVGTSGPMLAMGGPINLGQRPVMDIQTTSGKYWRGAVYDNYDGIHWTNTQTNTASIPANDSRLNIARDSLRTEVTQTVMILMSGESDVYAATQPIRFTMPVDIRYGRPPSVDSNPTQPDVAFIRVQHPWRKGDTYSVASLISFADEDSLRMDSIQYSEWISKTYLQLPDKLPDRVRTLAKDLTAASTNPYDKVVALEKYLRTKIKYNEQVNAPPPGRDGVDYVLFDRPEGYCNYYASALTVLARAVGLPARIVSGYTAGEYKEGVFRIVEANAHAWVEVYFPHYGWIEFEPTASKPEIERPKKPDSATDQTDFSDAALSARNRRNNEQELEDLGDTSGATPRGAFDLSFLNNPERLIIVCVFIMALLTASALVVTLRKRTRRLALLQPAARVYEDMLTRARWLGISDQAYATPLERAETIGRALPDAKQSAAGVAIQYTRERFGAHTLDVDERQTLNATWQIWCSVWRRGMLQQMIERITAPFRRLTQFAREWKHRLARQNNEQ